jgi:tripeptide aminopeptidase
MGMATFFRPPEENSMSGQDTSRFDEKQAIGRLMHFLAIEGITGQEKAIGEAVIADLIESGMPRKAIRFDEANKQIPYPTQTGNLIVHFPGTMGARPLLFATHLDTVPLCAGARPVRKGSRIVPKGKTALGGDNRTGVACLSTLIATLLKKKLPHPPLTFLFTVREESGLWGARFVDTNTLGNPDFAFNVDGRSPTELTVGAVGAERWQAEIFGHAAHAGVHPEQGVSATMVTSLALADVFQSGWFGKVKRNGKEGTSNVGSVGGPNGASAGVATNVVTDYVHVRGEARSHDSGFARDITRAYREAFVTAASLVSNQQGRRATVQFRSHRDYYPFRLKESAPVVRQAMAAAHAAGLEPVVRTTNGGLDANWLVRHGIPTVTFGAGQNNPHTTEEYVEIDDFIQACRYAISLATTPLE